MTVAELGVRMSHAEFIKWAAFYRAESGQVDPDNVDDQIIAAFAAIGGKRQ